MDCFPLRSRSACCSNTVNYNTNAMSPSKTHQFLKKLIEMLQISFGFYNTKSTFPSRASPWQPWGSEARPTPPDVALPAYAAKVTQPRLRCQGYTAKVAQPRLHSQGYPAKVTQPGLRSQDYVAKVTQPRLQSQDYLAKVTQPRLRSQGYTAKVTPPRLHNQGDIIEDPKAPHCLGSHAGVI